MMHRTILSSLACLFAMVGHIHSVCGFVVVRNSNEKANGWWRLPMTTIESPATLRSLTFRDLDKEKEPQLLSDFLIEIGACSTSIVDADRDTPAEEPVFWEPWVANAAVVCGHAAVGKNVWNRCHVTAHFPSSVDLSRVLDLVRETLDISIDDPNATVVPNMDWVTHVQQNWKPIVIHNKFDSPQLVLRFPWHTDQDVQESVANEPVVELKLEGGVAFGTGEHPTTQLCLEYIMEKADSKITSVLDYGTGSGVLGLAACALLPPPLRVVGVDIDVDSVRIANANAQNNNNNNMMKSYLPPNNLHGMDNESASILARSRARQDDLEYPHKNNDTFDLCVANILAGPLVSLAPTLASMVRPGGWLGLSGVLSSQAETVMEAYSQHFDELAVGQERNGWVLLTGTRKQS